MLSFKRKRTEGFWSLVGFEHEYLLIHVLITPKEQREQTLQSKCHSKVILPQRNQRNQRFKTGNGSDRWRSVR